MLNCRIAMVAVVLGAYGLNAADVTFPNSDGKGDLASAASWGLTELPDSSTRVVFGDDGSNVTLTASEDISFAGFCHDGLQRTVTLDMRDEATDAAPGPRKINLTANITMGVKRYENLKIRGGEWNLNNNSITIYNNGYNVPKEPKLSISDGALMHGVATIQGAYGDGSAADISISGEGTVVTANVLKVAYYNANSNTVHVTDGASLVLTGTGNKTIEIAPHDSAWCGLVISNNASLVKAGGESASVLLSDLKGQNYLHVLDGAAATIKGYAYLGHGDGNNGLDSHNNTILVSGASAVTNSRLNMASIYLGQMDNNDSSRFSTNNCIMVRDRAAFTADVISFYGVQNGIVVSNAVMKLVGGSGLMSRTCTNCFVRLQGNRPELTHSSDLSGNATFKNAFHFIYDLPPDGYASGIVPVRIEKWFQMDDSTEFVFNGIKEMRESMRRRRVPKVTYPVFVAGNGYAVIGSGLPAMLERWNSRLPEGVQLTNDNDSFYLTVEALSGTMMIFR